MFQTLTQTNKPCHNSCSNRLHLCYAMHTMQPNSVIKQSYCNTVNDQHILDVNANYKRLFQLIQYQYNNSIHLLAIIAIMANMWMLFFVNVRGMGTEQCKWQVIHGGWVSVHNDIWLCAWWHLWSQLPETQADFKDVRNKIQQSGQQKWRPCRQWHTRVIQKVHRLIQMGITNFFDTVLLVSINSH